MTNLFLYEKLRSVPKNAQKTIAGGRLKGFTDINPMWRIKALTDAFGPCGVGWWYEIANSELVAAPDGDTIACFVDIILYYKTDGGEVSHGIPGTGGSKFCEKEKNGMRVNDEAKKMALTDALGVAAKALGVGADVYFSSDAQTKYGVSGVEDTGGDAEESCCDSCGAAFKGYVVRGRTVGAMEWAEWTKKEHGAVLCAQCRKKEAEGTHESSYVDGAADCQS